MIDHGRPNNTPIIRADNREALFVSNDTFFGHDMVLESHDRDEETEEHHRLRPCRVIRREARLFRASRKRDRRLSLHEGKALFISGDALTPGFVEGREISGRVDSFELRPVGTDPHEVHILHPQRQMYLAVSEQRAGGDRIVVAGEKTTWHIEPIANSPAFRLRSEAGWMLVSGDHERSGSVVEVKDELDPRGEFLAARFVNPLTPAPPNR